MTKPKPGDLLTYMADVERTGVVLDRADSPMTATWDPDLGQVSRPLDFRVWVHREDDTFDKVRVHTRGRLAGRTEWIGHYTASGEYIPREARSAESA